jgi:hypothetical protein
MGVVARRMSRRASGTLTLTMPGSSGGGWSALAGRIPVSAHAGGWAGVAAGQGDRPARGGVAEEGQLRRVGQAAADQHVVAG